MHSRLGLALLALVGCADPPAQRMAARPSPPMDTVDGVVVVRNGPSGLWGPGEGWTLREEFRLDEGKDSGTFFLSTMWSSVSLGPQGHLFVLDKQADDIKILDGEGTLLDRIGGTGPGPGELDSPAGMGWDGLGRLWVAGGFNLRYTVFDSTGDLVKTMRRPVWGLSRKQFPLWFDGEGAFIDEGLGGGEFRPMLRVDTAGESSDTLVRLIEPDRPLGAFILPGSGFDRTVKKFLPWLRWAIAPDGTIWSTQTGPLRLVQQTLGGDTVRIVETEHRTRAIDQATRTRISREFQKIGVDISDYPLEAPVVQALHFLDDGHLLVQIHPEGGTKVSSPILDVFDPEGRFLGTLDLGFRMTSVGIPALVGDTIVGIGVGDLDVPFLVRLTIQR